VCRIYYQSGILGCKSSFERCRCAERDVIELCYNTEAGHSLNECVKREHTIYFIIMENLLIMFISIDRNLNMFLAYECTLSLDSPSCCAALVSGVSGYVE
jgi:hypothetical protein